MTTTRHRPMAAAVVAALAMLAADAADESRRAGAAESVGAARMGRLDAAGGGLAGALVPVPEAAGGTRDTVLWKSPRFATPFEFRLGEMVGITYPDAVGAEPAGPRVQLRGGDVIPATIESLDANTLVVSTAGPDGPLTLRIDRGEVAAIVRGAAGVSYSGPAGLAGWDQTPPAAWVEEAGRILTDKPGATVTRDVAAPSRARFSIRLSRRRAAEFRIAVAAAERPADDGYLLQAVGGDVAGGLMLVRRTGGRAAIEPLPVAPWRNDVLRIVLFVDQESGRLAAMLPDLEGPDGRKAFEVTMRGPEGGPNSGRFRLELTGGDICLERLEVTSWRGDAPQLIDAAETMIVMRDGALNGFSVASFDAAGGEYVLERGAERKRVNAAEVEEIRFPDRDEPAAEAALRLVRNDGGVISGDLVKVDDRAVWLRRRGIDAPVPVPCDTIVTIHSQRAAARGEEPAGRVGTLVVGDDRVRGWLVAGADGGVAWQPMGSITAAALAGDRPDAEVEYVPRRPERKADEVEVGGIGGLVNRDAEGFFIVAMMTEDGAAARDGRIQPGDRIIAVAPTERSRFVETQDLDNETVTQLLRGRIGTTVRLKVTDGAGANPRDIDLARGPISVAGREMLEQALQAHVRLAGADDAAARPRGEYPAVLVLRSGDEAPCRIDSIDAEAVVLRSPLTGADAAVRVPVELVKAVELIPDAARRILEPTLFDRLLTLPRMQRDRPPTHLLRLVDGDYLRGRLVSLDAESVTFEVLDVVKRLPRPQVARLIWLHPDVPGAEAGRDGAAGPQPDGLVVQGVAADGRRVTLVAERVEGNELRGRNQAFGDSGIDLTRVDRLLVGAAIGRDGRTLPFSKWVLKPAPEPRALAKPEAE